MRNHRSSLDEAAAVAWGAFERATPLPSSVVLPILFFGDMEAYQQSRLRALTVGLNPSIREFPADSPYRRFPLAQGVAAGETSRYIDALSDYFRADPYRNWFNAFELTLNGLGTSYYEGQPSTALHTDICSPVATDPTWSGLDRKTRRTLESDGVPLWHTLLKALQPHVVVLSVAKPHESLIKFKALSEREVVHVFKRTKAGALRKYPITVSARWYEIGGEPSLLVFAPAAQMPLGKLSNPQKERAGRMALEVFRNGL